MFLTLFAARWTKLCILPIRRRLSPEQTLVRGLVGLGKYRAPAAAWTLVPCGVRHGTYGVHRLHPISVQKLCKYAPQR
jgi:hypothetical protein